MVLAPNKRSGEGASDEKKRIRSMERKHEIIYKHDRGVHIIDLARKYNRNPSTICTILKQKDTIKSVKPAKGVTIISKLRTNIHDEMEYLLLCIRENELASDIITEITDFGRVGINPFPFTVFSYLSQVLRSVATRDK
ncbi:Homeobox domain-like [Trinorchestia longiramus]|nr:Homeobox domain-like [Trinorchestia longiramus]